jgi:hypothetical protein
VTQPLHILGKQTMTGRAAVPRSCVATEIAYGRNTPRVEGLRESGFGHLEATTDETRRAVFTADLCG